MNKETSEGIIKFFVESFIASTKEKRKFAGWCASRSCVGLYAEEVRQLREEAVDRLHHKHWRRVAQ